MGNVTYRIENQSSGLYHRLICDNYSFIEPPASFSDKECYQYMTEYRGKLEKYPGAIVGLIADVYNAKRHNFTGEYRKATSLLRGFVRCTRLKEFTWFGIKVGLDENDNLFYVLNGDTVYLDSIKVENLNEYYEEAMNYEREMLFSRLACFSSKMFNNLSFRFMRHHKFHPAIIYSCEYDTSYALDLNDKIYEVADLDDVHKVVYKHGYVEYSVNPETGKFCYQLFMDFDGYTPCPKIDCDKSFTDKPLSRIRYMLENGYLNIVDSFKVKSDARLSNGALVQVDQLVTLKKAVPFWELEKLKEQFHSSHEPDPEIFKIT